MLQLRVCFTSFVLNKFLSLNSPRFILRGKKFAWAEKIHPVLWSWPWIFSEFKNPTAFYVPKQLDCKHYRQKILKGESFRNIEIVQTTKGFRPICRLITGMHSPWAKEPCYLGFSNKLWVSKYYYRIRIQFVVMKKSGNLLPLSTFKWSPWSFSPMWKFHFEISFEGKAPTNNCTCMCKPNHSRCLCVAEH